MSSSQDRNLPATQRKLDQARKDGQVARSRDLSHLAVMGTGAVTLMLLAPTGFELLRGALAQALVFDAATVSDPALRAIAGRPRPAANCALPMVPELITSLPTFWPSLGPDRTRSGALPQRAGASTSRPYISAITGVPCT